MTKALPVVYQIPQVWPLRDGDDVVSMGLTLPRTHATAGAALPVVPQQHLPPPRRVLGVAVAAGRGIGSIRSLLDFEVGPRLPEHFDSLWHEFMLPRDATARSRRNSALQAGGSGIGIQWVGIFSQTSQASYAPGA